VLGQEGVHRTRFQKVLAEDGGIEELAIRLGGSLHPPILLDMSRNRESCRIAQQSPRASKISIVHKLGAVAAVAMMLTLAACTTSTAQATGVVTGVAYACQGIALPAGEVLHVKVSLYSASQLMTSETVRSGTEYRFVVKPGSYELTGWWGSRGVTVRANHRISGDFYDTCK
jgi:hypothetical protein